MVSTGSHKLYYSITEVANSLNVSASLIRFWEKQLNIEPKHRNKHGNRRYSSNEIARLEYIKMLVREKGYKLKGVRTRLKSYEVDLKNRHALESYLLEVKDLMLSIKNII